MSLGTRLRFFLSRRSSAALDAELRFHLDHAIDANLAAGMTPEEARRRACIDFGGLEHAREETARQHPAWLLGTIIQDTRYALRGFRRNPLFALTVIATLALAIGASTAVFSVVDRILFRPLPYAHPDRLVSIGLSHALEPQEFMMSPFYDDWRDDPSALEAVTAQSVLPRPCDLTERNPAQLTCAWVQANFLPTFGVSPVLGRNFLPEEDRPNAPDVALLSYSFWLSRYNRDPGILNQLIQIDGRPVRIVGVLPSDFEMPRLETPDVIRPLDLDEVALRAGKNRGPLRAFARLKPGVTLAQARASLQPAFEKSLSFAPPALRHEVHLGVRTIRDLQMQSIRKLAWTLFTAVLAVLLIACANVASLFMTRAAARERELAVRAALGAGRARLMRQTLIEAMLLSIAGGITGCILAEALLRLFLSIAPAGIPFLRRAQLDPRILLFTLCLTLACGAVFGLVTALQRPHARALTAHTSGTGAQATLRRALVVAQIACSMLLLSGAALLLRSFYNIEQQNLGIRTSHVLTAAISLPPSRYGTPQKQTDFFNRAEIALRRLPSVADVAVSDSVPPQASRQGRWYSSLVVAGRPPAAESNGATVLRRSVTPAYFHVLDIPILRGRGFEEADRSSTEHTMILSQLLASRLFPGEDPIGQRIRPGPDDPDYTVVGIAANVRNGGLTGPTEPEFYVLRRNTPEDSDTAAVILIQSVLSPSTIAPWVRQQIAAIDPTTPVDIQTLNARVSTLAARPRFETALLAFFAVTGLLMAVIGLYGVTAYAAAQRTQEVGVRMALGATRANILRLIAWEGARLILLGGALGLAAAFATAHLLRSMLFSIGPYDPLSFLGVAALLAIVALAATLIPARAAMQLDPVTALRYE
ncbi:MAG TPA: ABC transporter permease [Acidobacteriaceae bacterium]|jgi:predicted permease